jgi:hypothetical protein
MPNTLPNSIFQNFNEARYVPGQNLLPFSKDRPNSLTDPEENSYVSRIFFVKILLKNLRKRTKALHQFKASNLLTALQYKRKYIYS